MGEQNAWKEREKREIENTKDPSLDIKKNVKGTQGVFQLMAEVMELYLSKIFKTLLSLMGGSQNRKNNNSK